MLGGHGCEFLHFWKTFSFLDLESLDFYILLIDLPLTYCLVI